MSSFSVDGLISGLDTTSLINSLMQAERQPQVNLQTKKTSIQSSVDVYRGLNTKLQAIESAAADLASPTGWKAVAGISSDETVATVSVGLNATPVALAFHVTALAAAHAVVSAGSNVDPAATGQITGPVTLTGASGTTTISSVGDGSLNAVASAINVSTANVTATVVHLADGSYALQLASRSTGAASQFTVGGLDSLGTFGVLSQGADAKLTVGDPLGTHYDVTSSTNTFTGLTPGVSITAKKVGDASISVTSDPGAIADKVDKMVKAVNDALSSISAQSSYNATTKKGGALLGDLSARRLSQSLTDAVINAVGATSTSGATAGISVQRDGTVAFDRQKFLDSYQADPTALAKVLQTNATVDTSDDGIAERLRRVADSATDTVSGSITLAIQSRTDEMKQLDDAISSWDSRLSAKQNALKTMFSNMEVALSQLKSQSNWLAGQIAKL